MKQRFKAAVAAMLLTGLAGAAGACEIEDWRWYTQSDTLVIEGVATCRSGRLVLRIYEGEGEATQFLGVADTFIEGYAFTAYTSDVTPPDSVTIKYTIDPGG